MVKDFYIVYYKYHLNNTVHTLNFTSYKKLSTWVFNTIMNKPIKRIACFKSNQPGTKPTEYFSINLSKQLTGNNEV